MENIEKNCWQGLKRSSKLLENMMCKRKILFIEVYLFATRKWHTRR